MPKIAHRINDQQKFNDLKEAYAVRFNYQDMVPDGNGGLMSNPESKRQFMKRMIRQRQIMPVYQDYKRTQDIAALPAHDDLGSEDDSDN